MNSYSELLISVSTDNNDPEELQELALQLKSEISQLHVASVEDVVHGKNPDGTKGTDWIAIGEIVVTLSPVIIPPLFNLLKSWVERKPSTPVKIKIKVGKNKSAQIEYDPTKTSAEQLEDLVKSLGKSIK